MTSEITSPSNKIFNVRPEEWGLLGAMLGLLALNTMVYQISSVVATGDFLGEASAIRVPILWIIGFVVILLVSTLYSAIVDRVSRLNLLTWTLIGFAVLYLCIQLMITYGVASTITAGILYMLADVQLVIFPMVFWRLANDVYTLAQGRRLFPLIAAGSAIGSIAGSGVAAASTAIFVQQGQSLSNLLTLGAVVFLFGVIFLRLAFRKQDIRARRSIEADSNVVETFKVGLDVIANVPIFRFLGLSMLLVGLMLTVIEYHFLFTVERAFDSQASSITAFYGVYQMAIIVTTWLVQWLISGRLLQKVALKSAFWLLPAVCLGAILLSSTLFVAVPAVIGGAVGRFLARLAQRSWDEPARNSLQSLVPDERRGRVSTFIDSYFYAASTIVGSVMLVALIQLNQSGMLNEQAMIATYLGVAGVAAVGAVLSALLIMRVYDQSLLNWRLSRSKRGSVLDKVQF